MQINIKLFINKCKYIPKINLKINIYYNIINFITTIKVGIIFFLGKVKNNSVFVTCDTILLFAVHAQQ